MLLLLLLARLATPGHEARTDDAAHPMLAAEGAPDAPAEARTPGASRRGVLIATGALDRHQLMAAIRRRKRVGDAPPGP